MIFFFFFNRVIVLAYEKSENGEKSTVKSFCFVRPKALNSLNSKIHLVPFSVTKH